MANQEQLVALVDSLNERFSELIRDVKHAASLHAFTAYAEVRKGWCYPSHFVAFDEFVRGLFDAVADVHKEGKQLLAEGNESHQEATEYLIARGYKLEENAKINACDRFRKDDELDEREKENVRDAIKSNAIDLIEAMCRACRAGVFKLDYDDLEAFLRPIEDDFEEVRSALEDAKFREATPYGLERKKSAVASLRRTGYTD